MRGLPFAENFKFVAFFSQLESVKLEQSLLMVQSPHLTHPLNHMFSEWPTRHLVGLLFHTIIRLWTILLSDNMASFRSAFPEIELLNDYYIREVQCENEVVFWNQTPLHSIDIFEFDWLIQYTKPAISFTKWNNAKFMYFNPLEKHQNQASNHVA